MALKRRGAPAVRNVLTQWVRHRGRNRPCRASGWRDDGHERRTMSVRVVADAKLHRVAQASERRRTGNPPKGVGCEFPHRLVRSVRCVGVSRRRERLEGAALRLAKEANRSQRPPGSGRGPVALVTGRERSLPRRVRGTMGRLVRPPSRELPVCGLHGNYTALRGRPGGRGAGIGAGANSSWTSTPKPAASRERVIAVKFVSPRSMLA